jgi:tRNA (guanosine-2'-O-)-methyltransferase
LTTPAGQREQFLINMTTEREEKIRRAVRMTQTDLTVVLENIFDPLNISAVLRSCDAVGIREIFVLYTKEYLDKRGLVLGKKTSAGTFKWMDVYVFDDMETCFAQVKERYHRVLATLPGEKSNSLFDLDLSAPTALFFGNEDEGISEKALSLCDGYFTIPQAGFAESLNISVACAVTLFEASRQRAVKGFYTAHPQLTETQQELLFDRWSNILRNGEYRNRGVPVGKDDGLIPPVFVEREEYIPEIIPKAIPVTKFDL